MKKSKKLLSSFILALVFVIAWFKLVDLGQLGLLFSQIRLVFLLPVLGIMVTNTLLVSWRWQILMRPVGKASVWYFWGVNLVSRVPALLIPFRAGGFLQAYLVKKKINRSYSTCFAVLWVDLLISLSVFFLFSFVSLLYLVGRAENWWILGTWLAISFLILISMILMGERWVKRFDQILQKLPLSKKVKQMITTALVNFSGGFKLLNQKRGLMIWALVISLASFILGGVRMSLIFSALGVGVPIFLLLLAQALFGLSGLLPGTPARIGQHELIGLAIFSLFLGLDSNLIAAAVLLSHLLSVSFTLAAGLFASFFFPPALDKSKNIANLFPFNN